ncbi:MAG TPA: WG repeat-containing protein [Mucilaginibacter sp.]
MKIKKLIWVAVFITGLWGCRDQPKEKSDKQQFEEIINNPKVNSKEVGEQNGIKYFQVIENGKTGFRDLDGNIVIKPIFDNAEMFSEGLSTVQIGNKYGLINEKGEYILPLQNLEYLGSVHNGLASFREKSKYGFINIKGEQKIKPQFDWVDEFSENRCVVRNDNGKLGSGKYGFIDTSGHIVIALKFQYADKFEKSQAKIELGNLWGAIDKTGKIIIPATHKYGSGW